MSAENRPKILIVDDDEAFRNLVVRLLSPRGFEVLEARSTRDANVLLSKNQFALLIVDYKLPDCDGMTWIQQLRERNFQVPIAFCSGIWCDQKTFSWLRNILRVSLVLNKPIDPQLFVEVIESVVPRAITPVAEEENLVMAVADKSIVQIEYEQILNKFPGSAMAKVELERIIDSPETEADLLEKLKMLRRKLEVEEAVNVAKVKYLGELGQIWPVLTKEIRQYKEDHKNKSAYETAVGLAHKLRGTAGSFHIHHVAHAAGKLEDMLQTLDPTDDLSAEVIWSEIFRHLSEGEISIREERAALGSFTVADDAVPLIRLLFVGVSPVLQALSLSPEITAICDCASVESLEKALASVRNNTFGAVVIGPPLSNHPQLLKFLQEVRVSEGNQQVPLVLIADEPFNFSDAQLKYAGIAERFHTDITPSELAECVVIVASELDKYKSRILLVDDDEVLTNFVGRILRSHGYVVEALNEPIRIMEALNLFEPHLLILDVIMPGLTGYDVCRLIRGDAHWKDLTVLFLTAKSTAEGRANAFRAGGNDLLSKPVLTEELLARVDTYLQIARLKQVQLDIDAATNLLNRNTFLRRSEKLFDLSAENFTLCLFAVDDYSTINEEHGEFACETILATLGRLIKTRFQTFVLKGRWGEKGFALCFGEEDLAMVNELMQQLQEELQTMSFFGRAGETFRVSFTTGVAQSPADGVTFEQIRDRAVQKLLDNIRDRSRLVNK
ncbi:MAG: response regulator [Cyanobacteria bacterium SZAS TMP-1]|nr:response regulator [Cyanobacteria bacterium SZAS TMP-1]